MAWTPLQSSMIDAMDYDADLKVLHLLLTGGSRLTYRDVPAEVARELVEAPSAGRYFHQSIKGRFVSI